MEREIIIAGNWKMHKTAKEAEEFIESLAPKITMCKEKIYLAVPYTMIANCSKKAQKTNIIIGAQNMNDAQKGAFTGEIAGLMLKEAGAEFVLLGHSERRHIFQETNTFINKKVIRALLDDIQPILCVGETEEERENDKTEKVIKEQLFKCLDKVAKEDILKTVIAYEPVWAIGTGKTATPKIAQTVHSYIRQCIAEFYDSKTADKISILYGGSVKADNINELMKEKDIDGALIGGASLEVDSFYQIIENSRG